MQFPRDQLLKQIAELERRYTELEHAVAEQAGASQRDPNAYQRLAKELAELREIALAHRSYHRIDREIGEAEAMANAQGERELREMARGEVALLREEQLRLLGHFERFWQARHQLPDRRLIVEIRPGTGGSEASLFAADLYRMYTKYAARCGFTVEPLQGTPSEAGGLKEISFSVDGQGAWQQFRYESGVHRVQRVPVTEASGRIHTSTVTVAVLPEPEDVELPEIPAKELIIDVFRASGPGGQGVNTTDSAVRMRHQPTGLVVTCQDERSQLRNRDKAMRVLRARLLDRLQQDQHARIASDRRKQIGTGERSEKIRTYNVPDQRVTDHRIGMTLRRLDQILDGDLQELVQALIAHDQGASTDSG